MNRCMKITFNFCVCVCCFGPSTHIIHLLLFVISEIMRRNIFTIEIITTRSRLPLLAAEKKTVFLSFLSLSFVPICDSSEPLLAFHYNVIEGVKHFFFCSKFLFSFVLLATKALQWHTWIEVCLWLPSEILELCCLQTVTAVVFTYICNWIISIIISLRLLYWCIFAKISEVIPCKPNVWIVLQNIYSKFTEKRP